MLLEPDLINETIKLTAADGRSISISETGIDGPSGSTTPMRVLTNTLFSTNPSPFTNSSGLATVRGSISLSAPTEFMFGDNSAGGICSDRPY